MRPVYAYRPLLPCLNKGEGELRLHTCLLYLEYLFTSQAHTTSSGRLRLSGTLFGKVNFVVYLMGTCYSFSDSNKIDE